MEKEVYQYDPREVRSTHLFTSKELEGGKTADGKEIRVYNKTYTNKKEIKKCVEVEQRIIDKYGSYQIGRLDIIRRDGVDLAPKALKRLIRQFFINKYRNLFGDCLLGYIWKLEKSEEKHWHVHMNVFWRSDCDGELLTRELCCYLLFLDILLNHGTMNVYFVDDSPLYGISIDKWDYVNRNKVLIWLRYICKENKDFRGRVDDTGMRYLTNEDRENGLVKGENTFGTAVCSIKEKKLRDIKGLPDYNFFKMGKSKRLGVEDVEIKGLKRYREDRLIRYLDNNKDKKDMWPGAYFDQWGNVKESNEDLMYLDNDNNIVFRGVLLSRDISYQGRKLAYKGSVIRWDGLKEGMWFYNDKYYFTIDGYYTNSRGERMMLYEASNDVLMMFILALRGEC
jgi:hypothetical protein